MNELVQTAALVVLIGYGTAHAWLLHGTRRRLARVERHMHLRGLR